MVTVLLNGLTIENTGTDAPRQQYGRESAGGEVFLKYLHNTSQEVYHAELKSSQQPDLG
jgi:hypothetical protein